MTASSYFIATSWGDKAVSLHFRALAQRLAERGHRVVLLMAGRKRGLDEENHDANPALYTWPSARPTGLRDARFLYRLIRQRRPDCLISNFGAVNVMMTVGWLAGVACRVPWYHTMSAAIDIDDTSRGWKKEFLRLRKRLVYKLATAVVPASDASRDDVGRTYGVPRVKCQVFYNSLADPLPDCSPRPVEQGKLSCFGRLTPIKGQDVVVEAMALLKYTLPHVRVEFVGDGPSMDSFQQLAQSSGVGDRTSFLRSVSHDEVLERMSTSETTLVPSRSDNCPLVVIESLAVGTPVIASRVGGIAEMIRDGIDGFLVPPDDPGALAEKIGELLSRPGLRESMSRNARQRFLTLFEQSRVVREQTEWFERIVGSESATQPYVNEEYT